MAGGDPRPVPLAQRRAAEDGAAEDQERFSFEEAYQAQIRIQQELRSVSSAQADAATCIRRLDAIAQAAVRYGIFGIREEDEHADLVKKYQAILNHLALLEDALEPARRTLTRWRQHY